MFVALWEFEVKPRREQRFQEVYRPGDCDSLFRADPNHAGNPTVPRHSSKQRLSHCRLLALPQIPTRNSLLFGEANTKR